MSFDPAEYCARVTAAARAGDIKISGAHARPGGQDRKGAWRAVAQDQARREALQVAVVVRTLSAAFAHSVPPVDVDARPLAPWAEHFGRNVGQLWVLSYRAATKGHVSASMDELADAQLDALYGYLATEYIGIVQRLGSESSFLKRLSVPMVTTAVVDEILAEPRFTNLGRAVIRSAVCHNPTDPIGYLDATATRLRELLNDPRFDWFDPSVVKHAVVHRRHDPEVFLEEVEQRFHELRAAQAWSGLSDATIMHAVVNYPTRPDAYLGSVLTAMEELAQRPEYAELPKGVLRIAAERHPKSASRFLDRHIRLTAELQESEFADLGAVALRTATTIYGADPVPYLRRVRASLEDLSVDEQARRLPEYERKRIAAHYEDPIGFVREVFEHAATIAPAFRGFTENQRIRFCAYFPERARALAAGAMPTPRDVARMRDRRSHHRAAAAR